MKTISKLDDNIVVETENGEEKWKLSDMLFCNALREAQGFVLLQPTSSIEFCVDQMVSPDGHGYGHLIDEY